MTCLTISSTSFSSSVSLSTVCSSSKINSSQLKLFFSASLSSTSRLCEFQIDTDVSAVSFLWFLVRSVQIRISLDLSHNFWVTKWNSTTKNRYLLINLKKRYIRSYHIIYIFIIFNSKKWLVNKYILSIIKMSVIVNK